MSQTPQTDAGVDHDRNNARFEQRKHQREKVETGPDHEHRPRSSFDSGGNQAQGDLIAVTVELTVGQMRVARATGAISSRRRDDRPRVRLSRRHRDQVRGDVRRLGENDVPAQPTGSRMAGWAARNCCTSRLIESASSSNR